MIQTSAGVFERPGDGRWQSPSHQTSIEVDTKDGVRRRSVAGIRSPNYFGGHVRGILTDEVIAKYLANGTYETRGEWSKLKKAKEFLPKLIYDPSKQDFV